MKHLENTRAVTPDHITVAVGLVLSIALSLVIAAALQGFWVGFSGADESSHFLNAFFISEYARGNTDLHPIAAASSFYAHYPKLSIGHWPPLYYLLTGAVFVYLSPTVEHAMVLNVLIATLPAAFVLLVVGKLAERAAAVLACLWYGTLPIVVQAQIFFMADQAVTLLTGAAALAWVAYSRRPGWGKAVLFAALAAGAVLTKGNGWLIALFPPIHMALTGRWRLWTDRRTLGSAAIALIPIVPWYYVTAKISAGGFNFQPGLDYAVAATHANLLTVFDNIGIAGLAAGSFGAAMAWRSRKDEEQAWDLTAACVALILATFLLQSLIPADMASRYMAPALPPLVVLAVMGVRRLFAGDRWARPVAVGVGMLALVPAVSFLAHEQPKVSLRLGEAAAMLAERGGPSVCVIDGSSGAEGAFIAEAAIRDPRRASYVVRSSQLLSESNFMGSQYRATVTSPAEVLSRLRALGAECVVIARREGETVFDHQRLLAEALPGPASGYRMAAALPHLNRPGRTEIYLATERTSPNEERVKAINFPSKAKSFGADLPPISR